MTSGGKRHGSGRKTKPDKKDNPILTVRIPPELMTRIKNLGLSGKQIAEILDKNIF